VLRREHAEPPRPVERRLRRIPGQRIAALHDPVANHAVEDRAVERLLARRLDEVADVIGRQVRTQVDHDRPQGRVEHRLLAGHLCNAQRRLVRAGRRRSGRPARCL